MREPAEPEQGNEEQHEAGDAPTSAVSVSASATTQPTAGGLETDAPVEVAPPAGAGAASSQETSKASPGDAGSPGQVEGPGEDQVQAQRTVSTPVDQPAEGDAVPGGADGSGSAGSDTPHVLPELAHLAGVLASIEERLGESQRLLARQSDLADKLHAENQRLRAGELRAATLPLVRDLLRLHDDIGKLTAGQEETQDLDLVRVSLVDALARNGIGTFQPEPGEQFDPKQHSVAGVIKTEDASRDRAIAEIVRVGVQWEDGQTIRVADVRVYKYTPEVEATSPAGQSADQPNGDSQ
jgi:molecular chaperone GrpE